MSNSLKVAIAGLGTVGVGTIKILQQHAELLTKRCGRPVEIKAVSSRDHNKDRGVSLDGYQWFGDAVEMAKADGIDMFVELIGRSDGIARDACEAALATGKHVVTANKALIAMHGTALAELAEKNNVSVAYEAAVAGGIPIIKAIREGLAGNGINRVYGIMNGTCNYILSEMRLTGRAFDDVLKEAQEKGYAEADPTFDVDGIDTAHKLAILASVSFGTKVDFKSVHIEGIREVSATDIEFAEKLGYRIKLLGIARMTENGLEQRVHPAMVPLEDPIAHVEDVFNAVVVDGDFVDTCMFEGRGAGERPTASAVVADIADIARGSYLPTFSVPAAELKDSKPAALDQLKAAYYIRLMVVDRPGVFAEVACALKNHDISMESILQQGHVPGGAVPVVMTVHEKDEQSIRAALAEIASLDGVTEKPKMIRIESFQPEE